MALFYLIQQMTVNNYLSDIFQVLNDVLSSEAFFLLLHELCLKAKVSSAKTLL